SKQAFAAFSTVTAAPLGTASALSSARAGDAPARQSREMSRGAYLRIDVSIPVRRSIDIRRLGSMKAARPAPIRLSVGLTRHGDRRRSDRRTGLARRGLAQADFDA